MRTVRGQTFCVRERKKAKPKQSVTSSISDWFVNSFSTDKKNNPEEEQQAGSAPSADESKIKPEVKPQDITEDKPAEGKNESDDSAPPSEDISSEAIVEGNSDKPITEDVQKKLAEETQKMMSSALSFGNYLYGVASEASKKVTEKVSETATTLKKTVEEKSIIGDLNREQNDFLQKKRERQNADASVPPWVGYQEAETMKQQILALSADKRNFLRNPPSGVQFNFAFDHQFPIAMATLKEDEKLEKMRFELVPKCLKEEIFWRNYFYRVSLIKQSAQLLTLADMQKPNNEHSSSSASSTSSAVLIGSTNAGTTLSRSSSAKSLNKSDPESSPSMTTSKHGESIDNLDDNELSPAGPEFVSDAFDPANLNADDLEREMKQLGMQDAGSDSEIPEWEQELQKELQDYEVVADDGGKDDVWEKEIEDMLNEGK